MAVEYKKVQQKYIVRLDKGETIIARLTDFLNEMDIHSGFLFGIGAVNKAQISYYSLEDMAYHPTEVEGEYEVLNMTGNIASSDGETIIHAHITLTNKEYNAIGGHLLEAIVGPTLEVFIEPFDAKIERIYDPSTGLKLLTF